MLYFKNNLPVWERAVRLIFGIGLCLAALFAPVAWMTWAGIAAGLVAAGTGFVGFCPMCAMVGRRHIKADT
jgi:membrane protein implicated in regulation of membrane protease activity